MSCRNALKRILISTGGCERFRGRTVHFRQANCAQQYHAGISDARSAADRIKDAADERIAREMAADPEAALVVARLREGGGTRRRGT